nr:AAA family ATPase [uncultured Roseibium sp.]
MKLVSFSVENFRSITKARSVTLSDYSLLVGANNEGKSNILHALSLGMNTLLIWRRFLKEDSAGRVVRTRRPSLIGGALSGSYDWTSDFPLGKRTKRTRDQTTKITLEFLLNDEEIKEFKYKIKSNLNGTLPVLITFDKQNEFNVSVQKPGRGFVTLNKKSNAIARFVSDKIRFNYIPAIRTADSAVKVISDLVDKELTQIENNSEYRDAVEKITELQKPILNELAKTIEETVSSFLPNVKSVRLGVPSEARRRALRSSVNIHVDDGHETKLERKGDGVQSLVALALMKHASEQQSTSASTIVAIEEPEAHLHPKAIHELRSVISELSHTSQIVLSSHSPIFVNPSNLKNTIIVKNSEANTAHHINEIREALGVQFSDNLHNAQLVLIFEGSGDVTAIKPIVSEQNEKIRNAIDQGIIAFDFLGGVSSLSQKASFYTSSACQIQCFIDNDAEADTALKKALDNKSLRISDVNICNVPGLDESEIEDLFDQNVYADDFLDEFGVNVKTRIKQKKKPKWSDRLQLLFQESGKPWNKQIKMEIKDWLNNYASTRPKNIVNKNISRSLDIFIDTVERKISSFM